MVQGTKYLEGHKRNSTSDVLNNGLLFLAFDEFGSSSEFPQGFMPYTRVTIKCFAFYTHLEHITTGSK